LAHRGGNFRLYLEHNMLRLSKRKDSRCYYARGTHLGVCIERSLRTSDRAEAERLLAKLQAEIFEGHLRGPVHEAEGFAAAALRYMQGEASAGSWPHCYGTLAIRR
jgi:hypothetical protein